MADEVNVMDALNAYKNRVHALLDELILRDAMVGGLKERIRELEEVKDDGSESRIDPEE